MGPRPRRRSACACRTAPGSPAALRLFFSNKALQAVQACWRLLAHVICQVTYVGADRGRCRATGALGAASVRCDGSHLAETLKRCELQFDCVLARCPVLFILQCDAPSAVVR